MPVSPVRVRSHVGSGSNWASSGLMHCSKKPHHSITSPACVLIAPMALAPIAQAVQMVTLPHPSLEPLRPWTALHTLAAVKNGEWGYDGDDHRDCAAS
jgi:hypothetical protein